MEWRKPVKYTAKKSESPAMNADIRQRKNHKNKFEYYVSFLQKLRKDINMKRRGILSHRFIFSIIILQHIQLLLLKKAVKKCGFK